MSSTGECFAILPPNCAQGSIVFGRNAEDATALNDAQEVHFFDGSEVTQGKSDGGAEPETAGESLRVILQKPCSNVWGGDYGANERNVVVAVSWTSNEADRGSGNLLSTDIVRYILATASSAGATVECIGALFAAHAGENTKSNFVVCDSSEVWIVSCGNRLWAAQRVTRDYQRFPCTGLLVTTKIDKSSEGLADALKTLGLWNGEDELSFAAAFGAMVEEDSGKWIGTTPTGDGSYTLTSMFDTLRSAAKAETSRSATVSVLATAGISSHWFTATPNANESVFKPFVFAPNTKISPLTKVPADNNVTLLHKLHAQRKPAAVDDLKALEASCVDEMNSYLSEHPVADEELDELLKDCVEAEVKFYR